MDLSTIIGIGVFAGITGLAAAILIFYTLRNRLLGVMVRFVDEYVANFVGQFSKNDEFRQSLTEPVIQDALALLLANKDAIVSELLAAVQKELGSNSGGNLKIGGLKIPNEVVGMIANMLGGTVKNKAAEGLAGSLLG